MLTEITDIVIKNKEQIKEEIARLEHPSYRKLFDILVNVVRDNTTGYARLDPSRVTRIDYGDYQGTILFIVATDNYQPDTFYCTKVDYGSCSVCDSLEAAYNDPNAIYTIVLHMAQNMKVM